MATAIIVILEFSGFEYWGIFEPLYQMDTTELNIGEQNLSSGTTSKVIEPPDDKN